MPRDIIDAILEDIRAAVWLMLDDEAWLDGTEAGACAATAEQAVRETLEDLDVIERSDTPA